MAWWTSTKGQYSLEVVISVTLLAFIISGVFVLFGSTISETNELLHRAQAQAFVMEGMQAVRSIRDRDASELTPGTHGLVFTGDQWELSGSSDQLNGLYVRTVTITDLGEEGLEVVTNVEWPFKSRFSLFTGSTRVTDWRHVEVWGDWGNPIVVGALDIGPQGKATDVDYENGYAYLTADTSSGKVPGFFTIDVSDPENPVITDSYILAFDLLGVRKIPETDYAYAVGKGAGSELVVFNVADPANINEETSVDLAGEGRSIDVLGSIVAIGTTAGVELYDVSDPSSPMFLGSYTSTGTVNKVTLTEDYLYAATAADARELLILSVTNPATPTYAGSYDVTGNTDGFAVAVTGAYAYLGLNNNSGSGHEFFKLSLANPIAPTLLSDFEIGGEVNDIATAGPYVYLATGSSNEEFKIYQSSGSSIAYLTGLNMSQVATGVAFDENSIFIALRSNDAFQIIQPSP